jgi:hypothetical protein
MITHFPVELLAVDHQHRQRTQLIDPPLAQLLQAPTRGLHHLTAHRALADAVPFGEVVDGLLVLAGADPVHQLPVDAGLTTRRRLK